MATPEQRLVTEAALADALGTASAGVVTGAGRPDGTRTPSTVGELYLDTAKTHGAILWLATTATSAGWIVLKGDTGRVTVPAGNGWTGNIVFQRTADKVNASFLDVNGSAQVSNQVLAAIPAGFTVTPGAIRRDILHTGSGVIVRAAMQGSGVYVYDTTTNAALYGEFEYPAPSQWPVLS